MHLVTLDIPIYLSYNQFTYTTTANATTVISAITIIGMFEAVLYTIYSIRFASCHISV